MVSLAQEAPEGLWGAREHQGPHSWVVSTLRKSKGQAQLGIHPQMIPILAV